MSTNYRFETVRKTVAFDDLKPGDMFTVPHAACKVVYMKMGRNASRNTVVVAVISGTGCPGHDYNTDAATICMPITEVIFKE